jgi:hypothetical protein
VLGMAPLGSLQAGWVAEHLGVRTSLALGGGICFVVAAGVAWAVGRAERAGAVGGPVIAGGAGELAGPSSHPG